eukprot:m.263032 g.263032  ORF g.263032 m.263032 type:complete len:204 (+) comp26701_c0_seq1:104-715(+)
MTINGTCLTDTDYSRYLTGGAVLYGAVGPRNYVCGIGLADSMTAGQGFILEFMGTLILLFTIYNTAIWSANIAESSMPSSVNSAVAPIPIGFAVVAAHLTLGPLTGCGINPMRVLGGCIMEDRDFWDSHTSRAFWIYFVGPFVASLVAPIIHLGLYSHINAGKQNTTKTQNLKIAPIQDDGVLTADDSVQVRAMSPKKLTTEI